LLDFWRLELIKVRENVAPYNSNLFFRKLKERSLIFSSTAIAFLLSACGRETRSTTDVPLADETTNVPTAYNDRLVGSDDLDTFTALAGDDEIYGFGGNDQIIAGTGNDTIYGGDGDDNIQPGAGDDTVYGEGGNDTIYLSAGADIEDGGDGNDTIIFGPDQTTLPVTINLDTGRYHFTSQIASVTQNLFSIENITSEGGADLTIYDTSGVNVITTNTGNDTIHSTGGNDTITTGSGNDTVYLGNGTYTVDLGAGDDTVYLTTNASSINGNTGTDEAIVRAFDGFVDVYIDLKFSTYFVPSKLTAQDGMDVSLQNFEKVTIDGNVAATILGTASADTLVGDAGADTITGRGGADTLTGGSRSDTFVFATGDTGITLETADTITDFATGTDKIDIATVGNYVEADGAGNANIAAFITDADASLPTTSIDIYAEYNFNGEGNTLVVIDEDKSGAVNTGDTLIILTGLSTADGLDAADFI
jgi:Ca2+-binding RTX toxin-like protein